MCESEGGSVLRLSACENGERVGGPLGSWLFGGDGVCQTGSVKVLYGRKMGLHVLIQHEGRRVLYRLQVVSPAGDVRSLRKDEV